MYTFSETKQVVGTSRNGRAMERVASIIGHNRAYFSHRAVSHVVHSKRKSIIDYVLRKFPNARREDEGRQLMHTKFRRIDEMLPLTECRKQVQQKTDGIRMLK